MRVVLKDCY